MTAVDLEAITAEFLQQCGSCDAGIPAPCTHPERDYRPTMLGLVREVERLRVALDRAEHHASQCDQTIAELSRQNNDLRVQLRLPSALAPNRVPAVTRTPGGAA